MTTTITDTLMSSDETRHTARWATDPQGGWVASWLPGRCLTRNQAITAMTLAEVAATTVGRSPVPVGSAAPRSIGVIPD